MAAPTHWVCPSCGAWVPLALNQCPGCKHVPHTGPPVVSHTVPPTFEAESPPWVRAVSIPTALVAIVAFFLPWLQVSCGPITFSISGYEFATGSYQEKLGPEHYNEFERQLRAAMHQGSRRGRARKSQPKQPPTPKVAPEPRTEQSAPLLWVVPGACATLLLLGLLGLPRIPTLLVSLVGSLPLAHFGVTSEQELTDPQYTGGLLAHTWTWGFWGCWLGLVAPAVVALLKPRSKLTTGPPGAFSMTP